MMRTLGFRILIKKTNEETRLDFSFFFLNVFASSLSEEEMKGRNRRSSEDGRMNKSIIAQPVKN